ncbi:MAG: peptidase domain-containing ABC transporter [Acidobacteria bacterium]|nr:peptidase domain-containing ABC transporter [Acidobacteriota bacterium]
MSEIKLKIFRGIVRRIREGMERLGIRRRVPVLQQLSMVECGAACLAIILNYYGRKTTVAEVRDLCAVGRDGLSALTILQAARRYGLKTNAYSVRPELLRHLRLPAIIHWGFRHFVVLESWSPVRVELVDPARGRLSLPCENFRGDFTGIVLTFEPGDQFDRRTARGQGGSLWQYHKLMLAGPSIKGVLAQLLLASLLLQVMGLALPFFSKVLIDRLIPQKSLNLLSIFGMAMALMALTQAVINYIRSRMLIRLRGRLDSRLMSCFVEHLFALPFKFFQQRTSGDLFMRLTSNSLVRDMLTNQTLSVLLDGTFIIVYLAILLAIAPGIGSLALVIGLLQAVVLVLARKKIHRLTQLDLSAAAEERSYLIEAIKGISLIKACGGELRACQRWSKLFTRELALSSERSRVSALGEMALGALRMVTPVLLLWLGARSVLEGGMSVGMMVAIQSLATAFLSPVTTLIAAAQQLQMAAAHLDRLVDVMEAEPEQLPSRKTMLPKLTGRIEIHNLSFRYNPNAPLVLHNISCLIEPGQKVALVGATGCGKSSLAMLLLGLFSPTRGEIFYDDRPLSELDCQALRSQFGIVLQDPIIFSDSIRQNIIFANPGIDAREAIEAAKRASLHDEIMKMPMGYETIISEGGTNLSGGQRQRLALARALAGRPRILLLDEATSHLDCLTEAMIERNLRELDCTCIVIAHRLAGVRNSDQILVLHEGEIVERGRHDELVEHRGYYAEMLRTQSTAAKNALIQCSADQERKNSCLSSRTAAMLPVL